MIKIIEAFTAHEHEKQINEFTSHTKCFATQTHVTFKNYGDGKSTLYTAYLFYKGEGD